MAKQKERVGSLLGVLCEGTQSRGLQVRAYKQPCVTTRFSAPQAGSWRPAYPVSYPQRHDNVFVVVGGVAGDAHLGLGVGVFEFE